jgi:hypothetical protein
VVEDVLFEIFNLGETFELSMLVAFAKLFAFVGNNAKEAFDFDKLIQQDQTYFKRSALLKLILEKMALLNDKFVTPADMVAFENPKPLTSEEEFTNQNDRDIFERFDEALKKKTEAEAVGAMIKSER